MVADSRRHRLDERDPRIGPFMVGMVLLIGIGLSLVCLLGVVMVAMTRHLLAHPDEPVHQHGGGGWSSTPDMPAPAAQPAPALSVAAAGTYDVPLDDMPAEVVAEVARRLRSTDA